MIYRQILPSVNRGHVDSLSEMIHLMNILEVDLFGRNGKSVIIISIYDRLYLFP